MSNFNFQFLVSKISSSPQFKKAKDEIQKVADDLKRKSINIHLSPEAKKKLNEAMATYQTLVKKVNQTEKQVESEFNKAISKIKKSRSNVEKSLNSYTKLAMHQKAKLEKVFKAAPKASASAKKDSKKTTKKAVKATKKVAKRTTTKSA